MNARFGSGIYGMDRTPSYSRGNERGNDRGNERAGRSTRRPAFAGSGGGNDRNGWRW
jgi:hypothetical protein